MVLLGVNMKQNSNDTDVSGKVTNGIAGRFRRLTGTS